MLQPVAQRHVRPSSNGAGMYESPVHLTGCLTGTSAGSIYPNLSDGYAGNGSWHGLKVGNLVVRA